MAYKVVHQAGAAPTTAEADLGYNSKRSLQRICRDYRKPISDVDVCVWAHPVRGATAGEPTAVYRDYDFL